MGILAMIIISLPIVFSKYAEIRFIRKINNICNFDHNIYLLDSFTDRNQFINVKGYDNTPRTIYLFKKIDDQIRGFNSFTKIESKNTFLIVVVHNSRFESNLQLLMRVKTIQQLQINMKIGLFFLETTSSDNLQKLFEWSWEERIINIFAAIHSSSSSSQEGLHLNIFRFNPFGTFKVLNVTDGVTCSPYFLNQNTNFQQYPVVLGRVVGQTFENAFNGAMWLAIVRVMNASFKIVESNFEADKIIEKQIDAVAQRYGKINLPIMYPTQVEPILILVPKALPYSQFSVYLQTITTDKFFGYTLMIVAAVMVLLCICRYIKEKKILFVRSITDIVNLLMNDNGNIQYQKLSHVELFLIVPLTFIGLIVVNGILSTLQSYLTRPVLQPQINTLESIYKSPFPIITQGERFKNDVINLLSEMAPNFDWSTKVRLESLDELNHQIFIFNSTMSFLSNPSTAQFVLNIQKRLNIRGYHISEAYLFKTLIAFPVSKKFPFAERLNEIVFRIRSAGLIYKWEDDERSQYESKLLRKYKSYFDWLRNRNEADVDKFPFPNFIFYGWIASAVILVIEIVWKKFEFQRVNICSKMFPKKSYDNNDLFRNARMYNILSEKHHRSIYSRRKNRVSKENNLVHINVCGDNEKSIKKVRNAIFVGYTVWFPVEQQIEEIVNSNTPHGNVIRKDTLSQNIVVNGTEIIED